jgi:DNA-binding response OmpR family regulator
MEWGTKRILIIDDDKLILLSFKHVLELEGYIVDTAETGNEAIRKSIANFYNLALIDLRLPDMEGTRLLTEMKETTPRMRKIILTGHVDSQNATAALKGAADDYITKPSRLSDLVMAIKEQLRRQDQEKSAEKQKFMSTLKLESEH